MASNAMSMLYLARAPVAPPAQRSSGPSLVGKRATASVLSLDQRIWSKEKPSTFTVSCTYSGYDDQAEPSSSSNEIAVVEEPVVEEASGVVELKQSLVDSFYGTERGLRAGADTRGEIVELISQLEARNPTPAPTEALSLLDGKWILAYTSFSEIFPLLAAGSLPLIKVGEISQTIDSQALTVQNSVTFTGPLATTSFSTSASFEVRSPKRVQIKFEEGTIGTPQLTDSIELPESVEFLGQKIDLAPIKNILTPLQDAASSLAKTVSDRPPLKFSLRPESQSWLLTTYLDEDLRISRGDAGSVFVLIKEGSSLLL